MLFNSYEFLFGFLPITLGVYLLAHRFGWASAARAWLFVASVFFYAWWRPDYVLLLLPSIVANFYLGRLLSTPSSSERERLRKSIFFGGLAGNLALLAYFKYSLFATDNFNAVAGTSFEFGDVALPLAISFFTFNQIAFLVDCYRNRCRELDFVNYGLFVSFFPHLIAGPIVHHSEMMPQFGRPGLAKSVSRDLAIGGTIFALGLFEKAVLADGVAPYASQMFTRVADGEQLDLLSVWAGVLAYTLQIYFDFAGYSDMAIGGARMFGIRFPLNFNSPYQAVSIIDFWRRWHMSLSRFLRDYIYIPLGGSRNGPFNRYRNLFLTMLIGGLWHGAGWTFVFWGALHGAYLIVNHGWRYLVVATKTKAIFQAGPWIVIFRTLTLLAVIVGWVFFRSPDFESAVTILEAMSGANGVSLPNGIIAQIGPVGEVLRQVGVNVVLGGGSDFVVAWVWIIPLGVIALVAPNTQQIMHLYSPALDSKAEAMAVDWTAPKMLTWRASPAWAVVIGLLLSISILALTQVSEFLYFRF